MTPNLSKARFGQDGGGGDGGVAKREGGVGLSRGTGGNSKASARFHGHKTNGALGEWKPQHAVRKKPRRPRRSFAPCRKSTPFTTQILTTQIQPGGSKLIGGLCGFGCRLLLLSSPVKQEKPEPPSLPFRLPLPGQPLGCGHLSRSHS